MARKTKLPGLYWDPKTGKGSVDKRVDGIGRVRHRFEARTQAEAETIYHATIREALDQANAATALPVKTWRAAATRYLQDNAGKKSIDRDAITLELLDPHIGTLPLPDIHAETLRGFIESRRDDGIKSATVNRDLAIVRRVLTLASRVWRNADGKPWLPYAAPLIEAPNWHDAGRPYPLTPGEQRRLMRALPDHLADMCLFAIHTGLREQEICWMQWAWEIRVPEIRASVFLVPGTSTADGWPGTKNGRDSVVVLNRIARTVIESRRGSHPQWVFPFEGSRLGGIHNTAWRKAWRKAGLPTGRDVKTGPHNLRHTFGERLRAAGVPENTIAALLHHSTCGVTRRYSPAGLPELINAVEKLCTIDKQTILRVAR